MSTWRRWAAGAGFALGVSTLLAATVPANAGGDPPAVDPAALRILKQMTDHLDGLQKLTATTQVTIEEMHPSGHRVDFDVSARVVIKRPNKLLAARTGKFMKQSFYYDGKALTLYDPTANVYAAHAAPETVEGMLNLARETVGILLPAADLVYRGAYPLMTRDLTLAVVVGKAVIGGVTCDHLLFVRPGVDFQIWVEDGARPWPRKYVVTETDTPQRLSISTYLNDWNDAPAVDDAQFAFVPPKGASETVFVPYGTGGKSDR